jgi:hypothetical protein
MTLCPLLMPVAVVTLVWPARNRRALAALVAGYLAAASAVMTFFEAADGRHDLARERAMPSCSTTSRTRSASAIGW